MRSHSCSGGLVWIALLMAACTSASPTAGGVTPSSPASPYQSAQPTASPTSGPTASPVSEACGPEQPAAVLEPQPSSNRSRALVSFTGSHEPFVIDSPTQTSANGLDVGHSGLFVSASTLAYRDFTFGPNKLWLLPLSGAPPIPVIEACTFAGEFAFSPDGSRAVYATGAPYDPGTQMDVELIRLIEGGRDRIFAQLGVDVTQRPQACSQALCDRNHVDLQFSPDGSYVSLTDAWAQRLRIWTANGTLVASMNSTFTTWSVWSGDTLYFRTTGGLETWHRGKFSLLLPGLEWLAPRVSPTSSQIVFFVRERSGLAHVKLLDLATNTVRELRSSVSRPAFLSPSLIWYQEEAPCLDAACSGHEPYLWLTYVTGKTFLYDLQTGNETATQIGEVFDVWPHPA